MPELEAIGRALYGVAEVRLAYVFGSVARSGARPESDVDVAVLVEPRLSGEVERRIARALRDATPRVVDLVDLRRAPPLLLREVLEGAVVLCRDGAERQVFEAWAVGQYLDTGHLREVQRSYLHERSEARRGPQT